jgi:hypothetical protein
MNVHLSLPQLRRIATLLTASVATGNRADTPLRDTFLELVRQSYLAKRGRERDLHEREARAKLSRTGHKDV